MSDTDNGTLFSRLRTKALNHPLIAVAVLLAIPTIALLTILTQVFGLLRPPLSNNQSNRSELSRQTYQQNENTPTAITPQLPKWYQDQQQVLNPFGSVLAANEHAVLLLPPDVDPGGQLTLHPGEIQNRVEGLTGLQKSAFSEDFLAGRACRLVAVVKDVLGSPKLRYGNIVIFVNSQQIARFFTPDERFEQAASLSAGDFIVIDGIFRDYDSSGPDFYDANIIWMTTP